MLSYGHDGQRLLEVGRYEYTVGSGKQRRTYTWYYAGMRLPRRVPHLVLDSKSNDGIVMGKALISNLPVVISNSQRISLEGDFDTYFTLYAPKQYDVDVRYVLTPDVMAALVDKSSRFDVELVDDMAFFYARCRTRHLMIKYPATYLRRWQSWVVNYMIRLMGTLMIASKVRVAVIKLQSRASG